MVSTNQTKVHQAFTSDLSIKTWNQYLSEGQVKLLETELSGPEFSFQLTYLQALIDSGRLVPLLIERQHQLRVVRAGEDWQSGDRIICLLQSPKPSLLKRLSGETTMARLTVDKLPTVREVPLPLQT